MITSIKVNEAIYVDGPAKFNLLETNYEGHRQIIRLSIVAPKTTKIIKGKVDNND